MKTTSVLLICLTACCAFANGEDDAKINDLIKQLGKAKYGYDHSQLYRSLFAAVGEDGLVNLKMHRNNSIALQAAWQSVNLTVPEKEGEKVYRPDPKALASFLGFLEGRARVAPPEWWIQIVTDARANRRNNIYAGEPTVEPYHRAAVQGVNCPKGSFVEKEGDSYVYRTGMQKITIPNKLINRADGAQPWSNMSGCFTDKVCFLAIHDDFGYPHKLACIDRASNKIIWKSTVCGCWWGGGSGIQESWVSVTATKDGRVFVFGDAGIGFYAHGFRASDGKSLIFFSSNF